MMSQFMIYVNSKADEGTENLEISPADDDYLEIFPDGEDSELYLKGPGSSMQ
jgi:hypothetical protein